MIFKALMKGRNLSIAAAVLVAWPLMAGDAVNAQSIQGSKIGIVLMHGKGGTPHRVSGLGKRLRRLGVLVRTPSMAWSRGRIYDKGYEASMREIDAHVARLRASGAKRIIVGGHSLGANAALGYAARRSGLSGVVLLAYGHVPGVRGFSRRASRIINKARNMIAAGKGNRIATFPDFGGGNRTARATPKVIMSWFGPRGPARIALNAPRVRSGAPVLCVDAAQDRFRRCGMIRRMLRPNRRNRFVTVQSSHLGAPGASSSQVAAWLRTLK